MGDKVTLVSSAEETAKDLYKVLVDNELLRSESNAPTLVFRATGDASDFEKLAKRFLGPEVSTVEKL
jgi:Glutamate racemase